MEMGELYLAAENATSPLHLEHLIVLRESPQDSRYTCYFYNRMEGASVRMVSYHLADGSQVTEGLRMFEAQ